MLLHIGISPEDLLGLLLSVRSTYIIISVSRYHRQALIEYLGWKDSSTCPYWIENIDV